MPVSRTIDPGKYTNATNDQSVFVTSDQIEFDILVEEKSHLRRLKKSYDYSVWYDGSLTFRPMASSQYGKGVTAYKWSYTGSAILRGNRQNGQNMEFKLNLSPRTNVNATPAP
jgi:hypothetical protein